MRKDKPFVFAGVTDVTDCNRVEEVLEKSGLNFSVDIKPVSVNFDNGSIEIPNYYATYRTDTNQPFGIVKNRYTPVQNIKMFEFINECVNNNVIEFDTAGCLDNGSKCFIAARVPQLSIVGSDDVVENYIVFFNSHDGSSGFKIMYTPVRMVCFNRLTSAIKNADEYFTFKHTKNVGNKIQYAKEVIKMSMEKINYTENVYEQMFNTKIDGNKVEELFSKVILTDVERDKIIETGHTYKEIINKQGIALNDVELSSKKVNMLHDLNEYYHIGVGQTNVQGTVWGAFNAVTGYCSNWTNVSGEKRMNSLMFGENANKIQNAFKHCLELI